MLLKSWTSHFSLMTCEDLLKEFILSFMRTFSLLWLLLLLLLLFWVPNSQEQSIDFIMLIVVLEWLAIHLNCELYLQHIPMPFCFSNPLSGKSFNFFQLLYAPERDDPLVALRPWKHGRETCLWTRCIV